MSAALGAWQSGPSDVDTVILTSRSPTADDIVGLTKVHAEMPQSPPYFDGVYLEPVLAQSWPTDRREMPFVVNSRKPASDGSNPPRPGPAFPAMARWDAVEPHVRASAC
jgi:hypothetical protein